MTPASVAPGVSVVGMILAAIAARSAASATLRLVKGAASCFAEQAASVIAMRAGVPILSKDAPVSAPEDLRNRRRETLLLIGKARTFLLLLATT